MRSKSTLVVVIVFVSLSFCFPYIPFPDGVYEVEAQSIKQQASLSNSASNPSGAKPHESVTSEQWMTDTSGCSDKFSRYTDLKKLASRFRVNCKKVSIKIPREKQEELLKEIEKRLKKINEEGCRDYENIKIYLSDLAIHVEVIGIEENEYGPYHFLVQMRVIEVLKGKCLAKLIGLGDTITLGLFSGNGYKVESEAEYKLGHEYILLSWRKNYNHLILRYYGSTVQECLSTLLFPKEKVYELIGDTAVNLNCPIEKHSLESLINKISMAERLTNNLVAKYVDPSQMTIGQLTYLAPMVIRGIVEDIKVKKSKSLVTIAVGKYYKNKWGIYPDRIKLCINKGHSGMIFPEDPDFSFNEEVIIFVTTALSSEGDLYSFPKLFGVCCNKRGKYTIQNNNIAENTLSKEEIHVDELETRIMKVAEVDKQ